MYRVVHVKTAETIVTIDLEEFDDTATYFVQGGDQAAALIDLARHRGDESGYQTLAEFESAMQEHGGVVTRMVS